MPQAKDPAVEGWTARATVAVDRAAELIDLYKSLGFEVLIKEPGQTGDNNGCTTCLDRPGAAGRYKTIFTRPAGQAGADKPA